MDVFKDGLHVLVNQWFLIGCFLGFVFSGMAIIILPLRSAAGNYLGKSEYVSLAISGWILPVLLMAVFIDLLPAISTPIFIIVVAAGFLCVFPQLKSMHGKAIKPSPAIWGLLIVFLLSMIVNLAFISQLTFPAYFDSTEHYRIIKFLLETPPFRNAWPTDSYYHIGYHLILAALIHITQASITDVMLVSGQLALPIIAFSLYFFIKRETGSTSAALFTTLLAGFGWYMPGHAVNWGKYPAIFGLICIIFVINLLYLILPKNSLQHGTKKLIPILMIAVVISAIIHTRSLVVCGLFSIALICTNKWETLGKFFRQSLFGMLVLIFLLLGMYLRTDGTFISLLSSYWENDFATLAFVLPMAIFAAWQFPKPTFLLLLFTIMLFIGVFIPIHGLFGYQNLFLLDRPYIQMLFFIIFSLLGGLGLAGLFHSIKAGASVKRGIQAGVFGLLILNAIFYQEYYPSTCCQLAGRDDAAAFTWIQQELPPKAHVLISSQDLSLTPNASLLSATGIDGGLWIPAITGRDAYLLPSHTDFTLSESHLLLCNMPIDYIYVGSRTESFNESSLIAKPEWYQGILILPEAKIYQLNGCP